MVFDEMAWVREGGGVCRVENLRLGVVVGIPLMYFFSIEGIRTESHKISGMIARS